ncbi:hypothetical protein SAMN05192560_1928 [Methylobacillus rhizosphaerae]|uniref:Uncharacterized protein n=1 Tax=Methylobacillus rhizosphaerae TaxID=551994 RepID=A0A239AH45_9PROT|nr:hypothetical protein [Methylobacillus rhizosphaerae]SNR94996.1 hypothetical protein SAMN05192560_1928 [Methylobacillus rhizosphaerae]
MDTTENLLEQAFPYILWSMLTLIAFGYRLQELHASNGKNPLPNIAACRNGSQDEPTIKKG